MNYLVDSNILVYAYANQSNDKQLRARQVLSLLADNNNGYLSTQSLSEFSNVMLRKVFLPAKTVYGLVEQFEQIYMVYPLTAAIILEAIRGVEEHKFSYYDAQIWAIAKLNQIPIILSEDFNSGSGIESVLFQNPFDPEFKLANI